MPTILRIGPYRFSFTLAIGGDEPLHVHVERDEKVAKFWLIPIRLQSSGGFTRREINRIHQLIMEYQDKLVEEWHAYFGR